MLRQVSSRNQRAKGFRLKHAVQIGISVAICIWLLYQVKHSHEKKKSYDARNLKLISKVTEDQEDFFKFGRKDLQNEAGTVEGIQRGEEIEDSAQEEEEEPEVVKQEEAENEEVRGAGVDVIDEQDEENAEEAKHGKYSAEEKDRDGQMEEKVLFENESEDHEGGTQEAREENYKRDDVSSSVVHDARVTESGTANGDAKSMDEEQVVDNPKVNSDPTIDGNSAGENLDTVDGSKGGNGTSNSSVDNISDDVVNNGTTTEDSPPNNGTVAEGKESEAEVPKADNELMYNSTAAEDGNRTEPNNSTATTESDDQMEVLANSTGISGNQTEGQNNSTVDEPMSRRVQVSNDTVSLDSTRGQNSTNDEGTLREVETVVDPAGKSNSTAELDSGELSTASSAAVGNGDSGVGDSDDLSHVAMEEEKENHTDLSTIQDEAKNMDEEAAEE